MVLRRAVSQQGDFEKNRYAQQRYTEIYVTPGRYGMPKRSMET
jgi:hypothetical protein